ncbi:MAG: hypothetical protein VB878_15415 [Pirellulaceae bacterium]
MTNMPPDSKDVAGDDYLAQTQDVDPTETAEWLDSLEYVLDSKGPERAQYLLKVLDGHARRAGVELPIASNTP